MSPGSKGGGVAQRRLGGLQVGVGAVGGDAEAVLQVGDGGGIAHQPVITGGVGHRQGLDELDIEGVAGGFEQHQVLIPLVGRGRSRVLQAGDDNRLPGGGLPHSHPFKVQGGWDTFWFNANL